MKKLLFVLALLVTTTVLNAQKNVPFASVGGSVSYTGYLSTGFEVGKWGIESPVSYALTMYVTPKYSDVWVGIKPYWTVFDKGTFSSMVYAYPQVNVNKGGMLIEEGIGINYAASKNVLLGYYVGMQHAKEFNVSPFVSVGVVYLVRK
jgi:hypothetical protein